MSWRAMHVFYFDNQDRLLKDDISEVLKKNNVNDFFFIRYWENGPHIRLRLKNVDNDMFMRVMSEIENYINENKSEIELDIRTYEEISDVLSEREGLTYADHRLENNNTVKECEYQPELQKYSGENGVVLAEKEFIHSSKVALAVVQLNLKQTLKYIFSGVFACDIANALFESNNQKHEFFKQYVEYWLSFGERKTDIAFNNFSQKIQTMSLNEDVIIYIQKYYDEFNNQEFHKKLNEELKSTINENDIKRFGFNFVHLFNNRIGITPAEEAMIGVIAVRVLEEIDCEKVYN